MATRAEEELYQACIRFRSIHESVGVMNWTAWRDAKNALFMACDAVTAERDGNPFANLVAEQEELIPLEGPDEGE